MGRSFDSHYAVFRRAHHSWGSPIGLAVVVTAMIWHLAGSTSTLAQGVGRGVRWEYAHVIVSADSSVVVAFSDHFNTIRPPAANPLPTVQGGGQSAHAYNAARTEKRHDPTAVLNQLGAQGWEAVNAWSPFDDARYLVLMKRAY
jgi:hypothetical protein